MSISIDNFSKKHEEAIKAKVDTSIIYAFEIFTRFGKVLALNSCGRDIYVNGQKFLRFSSLNIIRGEFNDSAENEIFLEGIFETKGINKTMNLAGCKIKIYYLLDFTLFPLVTYFITEFSKNNLDFTIKCEPETTKYNKSLLLLFSKTCRAKFGDNKCSVNPNDYKKLYEIKFIKSKVITINSLDKSTGYYNHGWALFKNEFEKTIKYKIVSHYKEDIELEENLSEDLLAHKYVSLMPSCDKNFITCCKKFNNAINFRGEPTISENNFLKNDER